MKPITILIPMLAMLCGCEDKPHAVDMKEFIAFKIRMQKELYDINMRIDAIEVAKKRTGPVQTGTFVTNITVIEVPAGFELKELGNGINLVPIKK